MIQLTLNTENESLTTNNTIYLNLYNEIEIRFGEGDFYNCLQKLESQQTGKSIYYSSNMIKTNLSRYVGLYCLPSVNGTDLPTVGLIKLNPTDFPIGLYNYTVYENTSSSNLDPTDLKVIYNGLANIISVNNSGVETPVPEYTEYTTNDAEINSVYLTN
jgi:hypothetical protein|tara:strand:- start:150 stop:626 length:477 start_codon:yes stop_codon:yes gene_type:complete